jgi:hypothetical protein
MSGRRSFDDVLAWLREQHLLSVYAAPACFFVPLRVLRG